MKRGWSEMQTENSPSVTEVADAARKAQLLAKREILWKEVRGAYRWWDLLALGLVLLAVAGNLVMWWAARTPDAPVMIAIMALVFAGLIFGQTQRQIASLAKLVRMIEDEQRSR
jgi:hypothetical protein